MNSITLVIVLFVGWFTIMGVAILAVHYADKYERRGR